MLSHRIVRYRSHVRHGFNDAICVCLFRRNPFKLSKPLGVRVCYTLKHIIISHMLWRKCTWVMHTTHHIILEIWVLLSPVSRNAKLLLPFRRQFRAAECERNKDPDLPANNVRSIVYDDTNSNATVNSALCAVLPVNLSRAAVRHCCSKYSNTSIITRPAKSVPRNLYVRAHVVLKALLT